MAGTFLEYTAGATIGTPLRVIEDGTGLELPEWAGGTVADRNRESNRICLWLWKWAVTNPGDFAAENAQGLVNGVVSLGGMTWDRCPKCRI